MKLSIKSDYAARAVFGLAKHHAAARRVALRVEELGQAQGIPPKYLVQILLELKAAGIVRSLRGKEGGYLLAKPPAHLSLGDIIRAVHGSVFDSPALTGPDCPPELRRAWGKLQAALDKAANGITFQQLLEESGGRSEMYYI